jgi:hypothetical protein
LDEVSQLTFDRFVEDLSPRKIAADVMWQVEAQLIAHGVDCLTGKTGAGYLVTYAALMIFKGYMDLQEQENFMNSITYHDEHYQGKQTLSRQWWVDDWFGGSMTSYFGSPTGLYAPVAYETDRYRYEGEVILAPAQGKSNPLAGILSLMSGGTGTSYVDITAWGGLDYSLQSRNYMGYSDLNDRRLHIFYDHNEDIEKEFFWEIHNAKNSLTYLENAAAERTDEKHDDTLNKVLPYMDEYYPVFLFAENDENTPAPEFYEDYPIVVSEGKYEGGLKEEYHTIFKIWEDGDPSEIRLVPKDAPHKIIADIPYIKVYLVSCATSESKVILRVSGSYVK